MSAQFQQAISQYVRQGYQRAEQLSSTSVALFKKKLIGKKWVFLWMDDNSKVRVSEHSFKDLTKNMAENLRSQRTLKARISGIQGLFAGKPYPQDSFGQQLIDEEEKNDEMLAQLEEERLAIEREIVLRNGLGNMMRALKEEVERCLNVGYELKSYTENSVILLRRSPLLSGPEQLELCTDASGKVQRSCASCASLQSRLDGLISLYKVYRTGRPTPGRERQVLDKQFELDAEINALYAEMKYLGYAPKVGYYIL